VSLFSGGFRPSDKGEEPGHPNLEIREVGAGLNRMKGGPGSPGSPGSPGPSPGSATAIKKEDTELHCPRVFHYSSCFTKWF